MRGTTYTSIETLSALDGGEEGLDQANRCSYQTQGAIRGCKDFTGTTLSTVVWPSGLDVSKRQKRRPARLGGQSAQYRWDGWSGGISG